MDGCFLELAVAGVLHLDLGFGRASQAGRGGQSLYQKGGKLRCAPGLEKLWAGSL